MSSSRCFAWPGTRLFPLLVLAEATGLRRGEPCAFLWSDFDLTSGLLTVDKTVEETNAGGLRIKGTKSERPRDLVVPAYVLEVLQRRKVEQARDRELYGAEYAGHDLVFCRPDGEYYRPKQVTARVREVMRKAGLRRSLHGLRHSHASGMLSKGVRGCNRRGAFRTRQCQRDLEHLHASARDWSRATVHAGRAREAYQSVSELEWLVPNAILRKRPFQGQTIWEFRCL